MKHESNSLTVLLEELVPPLSLFALEIQRLGGPV